MTTETSRFGSADQQKWLAFGILAVVLVANVIATYAVFTQPFPGRNDFYSRWEGARSFWQDGVSPYSDEASLNIQMGIYGRPVIENEDPGFFVYPFYTVFLVGPTTMVEYALADAIWLVLLEVCLIAAILLLLNLYNLKLPVWLLIGAILWSLMDYFPSRGLFLGQPSHVVYVLQILTIWAVFRKQVSLAGVALAISTFKPQMGYLFVPFLLLWAVRENRWRFVGTFGVTFGALMLASFALQPDWFGAWLDQVRQYPEYTAAAYPDTGSPVWIITRYYLGLGSAVELLVSVVLVLPIIWAWYGVLVERREDRLLWTISLTLVITHLVALRTATPHFAVFNLIIVFYLKQLSVRYGNWAVALTLFGLFVFSWAHFLITVQGRNTLEHPTLFLPLPFVLYGLLWLTRKMWWEHAPRPSLSANHTHEGNHATVAQ